MWSTVVGNRINCHGVCWNFVSQQVGAGRPSGGALHATVSVPDGLGGWHVVQVMQAGKVIAQVPYYVEESIVGQGVSSLVVKEDQPFSVHLKGVGWTQLDNTVAVDYDNSYIGYGCGFNSNGDVVLNLHATGGLGTHIIDIYPVLYTLSPSFANTETDRSRQSLLVSALLGFGIGFVSDLQSQIFFTGIFGGWGLLDGDLLGTIALPLATLSTLSTLRGLRRKNVTDTAKKQITYTKTKALSKY